MSQHAYWILQLFVREIGTLERELALFPDDAATWQVVPGVTNSAGTLVLHLCGNLQWFIGGVLGGSGYVRDREREFSARGIPREELLRDLETTRAVVIAVMPTLTDAQMAKAYPEAVGGVTMVTGLFLMHLSAHLAFHLGQVGYLRRALTGENRSASPLPLGPLALQ